MCLIAVVPPGDDLPDDYIKRGCENNPDGWGLLTYDAAIRDPEIIRGSGDADAIKAVRDTKGTERVLHLRYSSMGAKDLDNTHPYDATGPDGDTRWMFHNGVFRDMPIFDVSKSDSWHVAQYLKRFESSKAFLDNFAHYTAKNNSRVVLFSKLLGLYFMGHGWVERNGISYSNPGAWMKAVRGNGTCHTQYEDPNKRKHVSTYSPNRDLLGTVDRTRGYPGYDVTKTVSLLQERDNVKNWRYIGAGAWSPIIRRSDLNPDKEYARCVRPLGNGKFTSMFLPMPMHEPNNWRLTSDGLHLLITDEKMRNTYEDEQSEIKEAMKKGMTLQVKYASHPEYWAAAGNYFTEWKEWPADGVNLWFYSPTGGLPVPKGSDKISRCFLDSITNGNKTSIAAFRYDLRKYLSGLKVPLPDADEIIAYYDRLIMVMLHGSVNSGTDDENWGDLCT